MRFAKYHGLGNDFLVVDLRTARPDDAAAVQEPAVVKALCDRQFGVGGDGVLAVLPAETADARMRGLNADGSEAEICASSPKRSVRRSNATPGFHTVRTSSSHMFVVHRTSISSCGSVAAGSRWPVGPARVRPWSPR